jgi:hypothetical protein
MFQSSTQYDKVKPRLTDQLDFLKNPEVGYNASMPLVPSSRGIKWSLPRDYQEPHRDPGLDEFCQIEIGTLGGEMLTSPRKYAPVFNSAVKRFKPVYETMTGPELGPGSYDFEPSISVHEPNRQSYPFKSQASNTMFDKAANQPPDAIQSIQSAILMRHWTSRGVAYSTRERFPRQRARWKD